MIEMDTIEDFRRLLRENPFTCGDETNREPLGAMVDVHPEEREDGLLYDNGKRYWASIQCRVCLYEWSFPKLLAFANRGQFDLHMFHGNKSVDKPWRRVCCKACWFARKPKCRCKCRRVNHQRGIQKQMVDYPVVVDGETFLFRGPA